MPQYRIKAPAEFDDRHVDAPVRILGIDLGTTKSVMAEIVYSPGTRRLRVDPMEVSQETPDGPVASAVVPSAVACTADREYVGQGARDMRRRAQEFGLHEGEHLFFEAKNDIGVRRTYEKAPPHLKNAAAVEGKILAFLREAALAGNATPFDRIAVTVPASFQVAQRDDTIRAAKLAGIELTPGDLLDEPVAAFIDYLTRWGVEPLDEFGKTARLLVLDFGGGTCDVAILELVWTEEDPDRPSIALRSVSRFHRLGGGDIDRAILHEVLLPQAIEQNGLPEHAFDYAAKKNVLEPAFLGYAEQLKTAMSDRIRVMMENGLYRQADPRRVRVKVPGWHVCTVDGREVRLAAPQLTAEQFERVLAPFLDTDLLYARESEYRLTSSIFAPVDDALARAGLAAQDIDLCLLAGGSSLIPQVQEAVRKYFPTSKLLTYPTATALQSTVARGAAMHAFYRMITGRPLIPPASHERLGIRTAEGVIELVPKGALLPWPGDGGWARSDALFVPEAIVDRGSDLRVEVVAGTDARMVSSRLWTLGEKAFPGDPLRLACRMDENHCLQLELCLAEAEDNQPFSWTIDNPLSNVVNPNATRTRIMEIEEDLRLGQVPPGQIVDRRFDLARMHAELRQHEKAIDCLKQTLGSGGTDGTALNIMGLYAGDMGDEARQLKYYEEAIRISSQGAPLFNLALYHEHKGDHRKAMEAIDRAIDREKSAPYFVLKARICEAAGDAHGRKRNLALGRNAFGPMGSMDDWALDWYLCAARMAGDDQTVKLAEQEQKRRRQAKDSVAVGQGILPGAAAGTARRESVTGGKPPCRA